MIKIQNLPVNPEINPLFPKKSQHFLMESLKTPNKFIGNRFESQRRTYILEPID